MTQDSGSVCNVSRNFPRDLSLFYMYSLYRKLALCVGKTGKRLKDIGSVYGVDKKLALFEVLYCTYIWVSLCMCSLKGPSHLIRCARSGIFE